MGLAENIEGERQFKILHIWLPLDKYSEGILLGMISLREEEEPYGGINISNEIHNSIKIQPHNQESVS